MAEELFALRGPRIDDWRCSLIELPILTILRKKGKVSRSRYLRRQRSERYLKGMILLSLAANFPNMSTVEPHEFCRRSYSRRAAPESMIIVIICKFRDHIKEFTYTFLIHRNLTYRTSSQPDKPYSINRGLTHQKLNEDASEKAGMPPTDTHCTICPSVTAS
jgi:hypothetical protein